MLALMETYKESKGELPPSLVLGVPADNSTYQYLIGKYGENYNRVEW